MTKKSKNKIDINWKSVGIVASILLNVIFLSGALFIYGYYKLNPGDFAYDALSYSNNIACNELKDDFFERARNDALEIDGDKSISIAVAGICSQDYKSGNYIELSDEAMDALYKDILKARGE